ECVEQMDFHGRGRWEDNLVVPRELQAGIEIPNHHPELPIDFPLEVDHGVRETDLIDRVLVCRHSESPTVSGAGVVLARSGQSLVAAAWAICASMPSRSVCSAIANCASVSSSRCVSSPKSGAI